MARTIIVTGASDGIGLEVAMRFARLPGHRVIGVHKTPDLKSHEAEVEFITVDLGTADGIEELLHQLDRSGVRTIDALVNCVGIRRDSCPIEADIASRADRALELMRVNFIGVYLLIEALTDRLRSPGGRVINITSRAAYIGGDPVYAASKAALASLQVSLAEPLGGRGITINSVSPGFIPSTGMLRGRVSASRLDAEIEHSLVGRVGSAVDVARVVDFLASKDSGYITGQSFRVDGGDTKWL